MILLVLALDFEVLNCVNQNSVVFKVDFESSVFMYADLRAGPQ